MDDNPGMVLDGSEFGKAPLGCADSLDVERSDERGGVSGDNVPISLPACPLESKLLDTKEMVTIEVYDTTTLTLMVPSDVKRRRSVLLGVFLVNVSSEELWPQLFEVEIVARLEDWSTSEEICEEVPRSLSASENGVVIVEV